MSCEPQKGVREANPSDGCSERNRVAVSIDQPHNTQNHFWGSACITLPVSIYEEQVII